MVQAIINIQNETNKVLNIIKAKKIMKQEKVYFGSVENLKKRLDY
jgi:hypothetical protein